MRGGARRAVGLVELRHGPGVLDCVEIKFRTPRAIDATLSAIVLIVHRFWNDLFGAMKLLPRSLLADRGAMQNLADFSMPIIRTVDALVGGINAMRVDAKAADGDAVTLRVAHGDLEDCVGQATAAFGMELLRGGIAPGCWYPAELPVAARDRILAVVEEGAIVWEV